HLPLFPDIRTSRCRQASKEGCRWVYPSSAGHIQSPRSSNLPMLLSRRPMLVRPLNFSTRRSELGEPFARHSQPFERQVFVKNSDDREFGEYHPRKSAGCDDLDLVGSRTLSGEFLFHSLNESLDHSQIPPEYS